MKAFLFLLLLVGSSHGASKDASTLVDQVFGDAEWTAWKSLHGKKYTDLNEEILRYNVITLFYNIIHILVLFFQYGITVKIDYV